MRPCPQCGQPVPDVAGAPSWPCPHCGREVVPDAAPEGPALDPAGAAGRALAYAGRRYPALLLLALPALLADALAAVLLDAYRAGADLQGDELAMGTVDLLRLLGVAFPLFVASYAVKVVAMVAIARRMARDAGDEVPPLRLGASLALGAALVVVYVAGVLLIVPFLVALHYFLFAPAALARRGRTAGDALGESRRFARDRGTQGYTALYALALAAVFALSWGAGIA
ncbi:MAG TPA: zinc ribbon domain-containing protein, partial [Candidatus Thermoplasmatota archaeon]|nr:zinc ribbon domain-containing protein [Candidatus Thermoplasmatota archaeon]